MAGHELKITLLQMRDHAREVIELAQGRTRDDLDSDRLLNLGLVRLLEIIGEAANRVPQEDQESFPAIPWAQIIALRNRLIHAYDRVDLDIVWEIIQDDLPNLVSQLEEMMVSRNGPG